jgi:hypothetical protein
MRTIVVTSHVLPLACGGGKIREDPLIRVHHGDGVPEPGVLDAVDDHFDNLLSGEADVAPALSALAPRQAVAHAYRRGDRGDPPLPQIQAGRE